MKAGTYNLERRELYGHMLIAPDIYWTTSREEIEEVTGGCGPGKIGDWFVPDTVWGKSIFLACQIHDFMYIDGLTPEDKAIADEVLRWNMSTLVGPGDLSQYRITTYFIAVARNGGSAFDKGRTPTKNEIDPNAIERDWKEDGADWSK